MGECLQTLHARGAQEWIVQHAQAPADAERLVEEGRICSATSLCSAPRSVPCWGAHLGAGVLVGGFGGAPPTGG